MATDILGCAAVGVAEVLGVGAVHGLLECLRSGPRVCGAHLSPICLKDCLGVRNGGSGEATMSAGLITVE